MTDFSKYDVLAVDDVPLNLIVVTKMLSRFNFTVRTANNAKEAMEAISAKKPDLILLDIMMPGIDGFEVLKVLRATPYTADIRVIILTALNTTEDVVKGYNLGANDFITKPIILEKLVNSVSTQLQIVDASRR
ncbi:MAG: response regulator [Bacteroidales bacterium]|nr:response regulator [Bacteroidales bacterium]